MPCCALSLLLLVALLGWPDGAQVRAGDQQLAARLTALLESSWKPSPAAMSAAEGHYEQAQQLAPADARVPYAMALAALQNRKYEAAVDWLEETLSTDARHVSARHALVWTHVLNKQYAAALTNMRLLAKQLSPQQAAALPMSEQDAQAAFLGRVIGYLTGPAAGAVTPDRLAAAEREILEQLAPSAQSEFRAGRKQSLSQFAQMEADVGQGREQAKVEQAKEREFLEKKLAADQAELKESRADLEEKAKASKARYDAEEAQVGPVLAQLRGQLSSLQGRARPLFDEQQRLSFDIDSLLRDADFERDRGNAQRLRTQANRLQGRLREVQQQLGELNAGIGQVQVRGTAMENRLQTVAARYQAESKQFNAEAARLQKVEKTFAGTERKLAQTTSDNTPKVASLSSRLHAFTSYEPLDLDEAREQLLTSLGK